MMTLTVLVFIQLFFCLLFFLYFRKKISDQLRLQEFKKEIDEVVILFNRQAERHINYLEALLANPIFNDFKRETAPSKSSEETTLTEMESRIPHPQVNSSHPVKKSDSVNPITLPTETVKAFYADFGGEKTDLNNPAESHNLNQNITKTKPAKTTANTQSRQERLLGETIRLFDQGMTPAQIAKKLSMSTAEVKLILQLKEQL